jgi:5S rRNA maturation endonuclease (ribonuclease M5)
LSEGLVWDLKIISTSQDQNSEFNYQVKAKDNFALAKCTAPARSKDEVYLFLDNDKEGKKAAQEIKQNLDMNLKAFENLQQRNRGIRENNERGIVKISDIVSKMLGIAVFDKSELYQGFKDVNEWWVEKNK